MNSHQFLGATPGEDGAWSFELGRELHGAFGGAFGGVVAAATVTTARPLAPGRTPVAFDIRFLRGLPAGTATATPTLLHQGRTLSSVSVDLCQPDGRLAARATISFVAPEALATVSREDERRVTAAYDEGRPWPPIGAPIVETLAPRTIPWENGEALVIRMPWEEESGVSAEAACIAADMAVGPPVAFGLAGERVGHPNPDLSLRFAGPVSGRDVVGVGRLARVHAGLATVDIEVWSHGALTAVGVSTSMLLPLK